MTPGLIIGVSFSYLAVIFAIAYFADKLAAQGRSLAKNPYIYTLSIAVFCTSWTFYGSVGLAATSGLDFLPIYLGPTLIFVLWSVLWIKIIRICKINGITSIADFIASRYGKSTALGGLVTVIAVVGTMPYISLQLKSIATSFSILANFQTTIVDVGGVDAPFGIDITLLVAVILAAFAILFGARHLDASEQHEGLVVAIAFESLVKLFAFLTVGFFVTFSVYDGFGDLFQQAAERSELDMVLNIAHETGYSRWMTMTILSMAAIICLPRQFHITVVENNDEQHLRKAVWLFPLYLLTINIFVLPIALAGKMTFGGNAAGADMFVLTVPIFYDQTELALFAFIGGLSAATAMVVVAVIALSTMVCNNLVMPILLSLRRLDLQARGDLSVLLLTIRRASILLILLLGYFYFRIASESYSLVTIGLVSFAAAAQFAPAILGGIFWKGASRNGALIGLSLGFVVWTYTLLLPSFAQSGWLPISFIESGPYGISLLKPYALFGMDGFDRLTHALFWSMVFNIGSFVFASLNAHQTVLERTQATLFVDVFLHTEGQRGSRFSHASATTGDLQDLVSRYIGAVRATQSFHAFARERDITLHKNQVADSALLNHAEKMLSGAIGSATARVLIGSTVKGDVVGLDEMYQILDETSQVIEYSRMLETKSKELQDTTEQLQSANERLKELDSLKDDFISTISHELRTPLTSIRAFSEILSDEPSIAAKDRRRFLGVITDESERLTRLIDQILDLAKMEAGRMDWLMADVDMDEAIKAALATMDALVTENQVVLDVQLDDDLPTLKLDRDKLIQVLINLLSNAVKFCRQPGGQVTVSAKARGQDILICVEDNGDGIPTEAHARIFEKFHQMIEPTGSAPRGSGLGLAISSQIVTFFGGRIWVENATSGGARFLFTLPLAAVHPTEVDTKPMAQAV